MNLLLQRVDDNELIRRIDAAKDAVSLYAAGVGVAVAWALHRAAVRLEGNIKVILDVSQKSVDMGYLEPAAVEIIWKLQQERKEQLFYHLSGLRLCSLFVDDAPVLVYAPVARLMEDDYCDHVLSCPSGLEACEGDGELDVRELAVVAVDEPMVMRLCDLKPAKPLSAIKAEYEQRITEVQEEVAEAERKAIEAEERAIAAEKRADEAEKQAVEKYKAQFKIRKVEFSVRSQPAAIGRKRAHIPSMFLVGVGNEAEKKLLANYRLFPDEDEVEAYIAEKHPEESIAKFTEMEKSIRDKYLLCVPRFGTYVRSKDLEAYDKAVKELKEFGVKVGKRIREALGAKIDAAIESLYKILDEQWKKSRDPWFDEYCAKHPKASRDRHEIFVAEMRSGAKGTDALVDKFVPEIDSFSTPVDETLAENAEFLMALRKMLSKRNRIEGVTRISLEDLIAIKPKRVACEEGEDTATDEESKV